MKLKNNSLVFVAFWMVMLILIIMSSRVGDPQGHGVPAILAWLIPAILGTIAIFQHIRDSDYGYHRALAIFALFLTTPATFYFFIPIPFFGLLVHSLAGGSGFEVISDRYWSQPLRTVGAQCIILLTGAILATCITWLAFRFTTRINEQLRRYLAWFIPFPVFAIIVLGFQLLMREVLLFVRNVGLYPFI